MAEMTASEAWNRLVAIPAGDLTPLQAYLIKYFNPAALVEYWRMVDELEELKKGQTK